ncbi:MAG: hypothetical protein D6693_05655 [Planctomycetota bacterium]|nr:MAG: hypothetical protein D6693_05655 [Planctomycetota bacterium]
MSARRHHYERAFEAYLRARRIPYVSVDEARKALIPNAPLFADPTGEAGGSLKSFDFVVYGAEANLLVDIKGRKVQARRRDGTGRLESWVTEDDVASLRVWQRLFGEGFRAGFVFVYWCEEQPPDALFQEIIEHRGRWYALRAVLLDDYAERMTPRSRRWRTVHLPSAAFERLSRPFCAAGSPRPEPVRVG